MNTMELKAEDLKQLAESEIAKYKALKSDNERLIQSKVAENQGYEEIIAKHTAFLEGLDYFTHNRSGFESRTNGMTSKEPESEVVRQPQSMPSRIMAYFNANLDMRPFRPSEVADKIGEAGKREGGVRTALAELFKGGKIARAVVNGNTFEYHLESVFKDKGITYEMSKKEKATM